jgi:hypothetical protein
MAALGAEIPYGAWRLTFREPAFAHLLPRVYRGTSEERVSRCPVAESLQPRLLQFQTNHLASAERNANALRRVIQELDA